MNKVDQYFYEKVESISFIDLKTSSYEGLKRNIPYPIVTDRLLTGIKEGDFSEDLSYKHIVEGMILLLAMDKDFIYKEDYLQSLRILVNDLKTYCQAIGQDLMAEEDPKHIYYFRFVYLHLDEDPFSHYLYARSLYRMTDEDKEFFRDQAYEILERISIEYEDFAPAYDLLGHISYDVGQYNKSFIYFDKALEKSEDDLVREEIRSYIEKVFPLAYIERGLTSLNSNKLDLARSEFLESKARDNTGLVNFYLGLVEDKTDNIQGALRYYTEALEKGMEDSILFRNLSTAYFKIGERLKALEIINIGLEINKSDIYLIYNRMVININMERLDLAKKDMDELKLYGDLPDDIYNNMKIISSQYHI